MKPGGRCNPATSRVRVAVLSSRHHRVASLPLHRPPPRVRSAGERASFISAGERAVGGDLLAESSAGLAHLPCWTLDMVPAARRKWALLLVVT